MSDLIPSAGFEKSEKRKRRREVHRLWAAKNRERRRAYMKAYIAERKEHRAAVFKAWRIRRRDYQNARKRAWARKQRLLHPKPPRVKTSEEEQRIAARIAKEQSFRALVLKGIVGDRQEAAAASSLIKQWRLQDVFACRDCFEVFSIRKLTVDHIDPLSRGGLHTPNNIRPLCRACNTRKKDRSIGRRCFLFRTS